MLEFGGVDRMTVKLGVVMDPIGAINVKKDTTLAMLLAAQARGWDLLYMELDGLYVRDGESHAVMHSLSVEDSSTRWFRLEGEREAPLRSLDIILMRKDPPFNMEYIYATYVLERAEQAGVLVVNKPQSIRDANEKFYTAWFPQCCPSTLVTRDMAKLHGFLEEHRETIIKPLDGMGGASIFKVDAQSPNKNVIFETLTQHGRRFAMMQRFVPEISEGDKRILLIDGEPLPYALARVPHEGDARGNLAVGATGVGVELSERDRWIAGEVGPTLRDKGLIFVGLDVIGDYLTEINVTSPTCIRELDTLYGLDIAATLMDALEARRARDNNNNSRE